MEIRTVDLSAPASALNDLIEHTDAHYLAFIDAAQDAGDRKTSSKARADYFSALAEALSERDDCSMARGRLYTHLGKQLGIESKFSAKDVERYDIRKDFSHSCLYPYGLLVDAASLRTSGVRFDDSLTYCRDELFAAQLMLALEAYLYVPSLRYQTIIELDETSLTLPRASEKEWYWDSTLPLLDALCDDEGNLPRSAQSTLLYLLIQRFKSNEDMNIKIVFDDKAETNRYLEQARQVLAHIDDTVLFTHKTRYWERRKLMFLAQLRKGSEPLEYEIRPKKNDLALYLKDTQGSYICKFAGQTVRIQSLHYRRDDQGRMGFDIDFRMETCFPPDTYQVHFTNTADGRTIDIAAELTGRIGGLTQFFDYEAYSIPSYHVFVPFVGRKVDQAVRAYAIVGDHRINLTQVVPWYGWQSRLVKDSKQAYWAIPGYLVRAVPDGIDATPAGRHAVRKAEKQYQEHLKNDGVASKRMANLRKEYWRRKREFKGRRIWMYYDKGFKGGDNGEYAFRYATKQNDGIEHVYLIARDSEDGKRLIQEGYKVIEPETDEAIIYALYAEVIFATHVPVYRKIGLNVKNVSIFKDLMRAKIIRLYHGFPITRDISYTQPYADYTAVAVGSRYERDLYTSSDNGFRPDQVIASSMPRYDGLVNDPQRQILFAPTWRPSCRGKVSKNGESLYNPEFIHSRYFQRYDQILNDPKLLETARKTGFKIKMFLHPRMAPQTVDFKQNDVVQALDCTKDTDYVTIMRKSDLMVTDYSSVMVDFAYMRKPVVYYQDQALPYWRATNFDYRGIGFGEVCEDPDALVDLLCDYMEHDCALKDIYRKRINDFFFYDDLKGSERLYHAVRKLTDGSNSGK